MDSDSRFEISERLLKMMIDTFRKKLSGDDDLALENLSRLYEVLSKAEKYDKVVAETMTTWTRLSQHLATTVHSREKDFDENFNELLDARADHGPIPAIALESSTAVPFLGQ